MSPRLLELPIVAGGRLFTQPATSLETVPAQDFVRLLNVYRDFDQMARMPGWVKFKPDAGSGVNQQYIFDGAETLLRLAEIKRGDGTRVIVGASKTLIKYYDTATSAWIQIGSGFSNSGLPWQAELIASTLVLNNAVDLPQYWRIGDAAVSPMHELREAGIASVGRIAQYNGFLFVGDIIEIYDQHLPMWINGYGSYTSTSTSNKNADFNILTANLRVRFDVTTGAGTITATLPAVGVGDYGFYCLVKKVDAGAGTVVLSPVLTNEKIVLAANGDIALLFWNGEQWMSKKFPLGVIPATDPYGIIASSLNITQHIADEQAWSDLGDPTNWAPLLRAYVNPASTTITLPFKPHNWTAKITRVAVIGGGIDGGTLGGQTLYPNGVLLSAIPAFSAGAGAVVATLEVTTDPAISYPRMVDVTRWGDVSTFVGKQRMGNGSRITVMMELNGILVDYQEDGIFLTRWTAQAKAPFALRQKYSGKAVPMFGDCVAAVRNAYHLYPSIDGAFVGFDGLTDPTLHEICEGARDLFFLNLQPTDRCWAIENPTLQAIWFIRPGTVMAYRYQKGTDGVSEINAQVDAAVFAQKPGGSVAWFVLGIATKVYQWGLVGDAITTWLRDAVATAAQITSGLNSFRTQTYEKLLSNYTPIMASASPVDAAMSIQIRGTYNPNGALSDFMTPAAPIPDPAGNNSLPCLFQSTYLQDELVLTDARDIDWRVSGRLFEFEVVGGMQVTRGGTT